MLPIFKHLLNPARYPIENEQCETEEDGFAAHLKITETFRREMKEERERELDKHSVEIETPAFTLNWEIDVLREYLRSKFDHDSVLYPCVPL